MSISLRIRRSAPVEAAPDPSVEALRLRLRSLHDHCLTNLVAGLEAMSRGDLTVRVFPRTTPIETRSDDPETQELIELFNGMLTQAQSALEAYNAVGEKLRGALGDHSCLDDLQVRLNSLSGHCLTGLGDGLSAMAEGDLTKRVQPATTPLTSNPGTELGGLGETST